MRIRRLYIIIIIIFITRVDFTRKLLYVGIIRIVIARNSISKTVFFFYRWRKTRLEWDIYRRSSSL